MDKPVYPPSTPELSHARHQLAPSIDDAFRAFSKQVFADGALPSKMKQIIAVAVAHVTQCPYCIRGHTSAALSAGARPEESDGSHLGGGRNACWRCIRPLDHRSVDDGRGESLEVW